MAAKNTKIVVGMAIGIAVVAAFVIVLKWAMSQSGATAGTPVGVLDLREPKPSLQVEIAAGATLHVRVDAQYKAGGDAEHLASSQLVIGLLDATGDRQETHCTVSTTDACTLTVRSGGRHVLSARVTWAPGVDVSSAALEIRSVAH